MISSDLTEQDLRAKHSRDLEFLTATQTFQFGSVRTTKLMTVGTFGGDFDFQTEVERSERLLDMSEPRRLLIIAPKCHHDDEKGPREGNTRTNQANDESRHVKCRVCW